MNFGVNRGIVIAGMVIIVTTVTNQVWVQNQTTGVTRVLVGAYIALVILALIDLIPGMSQVTTGIALLAALTAVLLQGPAILAKATGNGSLIGLASGGPTVPGGPQNPHAAQA